MSRSGIKKRRPVWMPSVWSRVFKFFWKHVRGHITFNRIILALFLIPLVFYLYTEVFASNTVIIDPFSVPKRYEEVGLTSEAMSRMVSDALNEMEDKAHSIMKRDRLALSSDPSSVPEIEAPGTKMGLRTLVDVARQIS